MTDLWSLMCGLISGFQFGPSVVEQAEAYSGPAQSF